MRGQILVLHCIPETRFYLLPGGKATALDFTGMESSWGLSGRLKACLLARSPWVLLIDDDLLITQQGLERLMLAKAHNTERLVSYHARCAHCCLQLACAQLPQPLTGLRVQEHWA